jgi:hypothetical protein
MAQTISFSPKKVDESTQSADRMNAAQEGRKGTGMTDTVLFTSIGRYGGHGTPAIVRDGVVGWLVGGTDFRPLSADTAASYGVEWTATQAAGYGAYCDRVVRDYRTAQAEMSDEARAEQLYEMRAAHGPGVNLVDIFTGERFRT